VEDIQTILNTLIYDGKAEMTVVPGADGENKKLYKAAKSFIDNTDVSKAPCSVCPVSSTLSSHCLRRGTQTGPSS